MSEQRNYERLQAYAAALEIQLAHAHSVISTQADELARLRAWKNASQNPGRPHDISCLCDDEPELFCPVHDP